MPLSINPKIQEAFFEKFFAEEPAVVQMVHALVSKGMTFDVSMFSVRANWKNLNYPVTTTVATSTLLKGTAAPAVIDINRKIIRNLIAEMGKKVFGGQTSFGSVGTVSVAPAPKPNLDAWAVVLNSKGDNFLDTIKVIKDLFNCELKVAKQFVDSAPCLLAVNLSNSTATMVANKLNAVATAAVFLGPDVLNSVKKTVPFGPTDLVKAETTSSGVAPASGPKGEPKPTTTLMKLVDAEALGQPVYGTSTGSVYHTIAISPRVKVAARILSKNSVDISIRIECNDATLEEVQKWEACGITWKGNQKYGSVHLHPNSIPVSRIVGAFLMGLEEKFSRQITNAADLIVNEGK